MKKIRKQRRVKNRDKWIPVSERLPGRALNYKDVLACFEGGHVSTSLFIEGRFSSDNWRYGRVVAWRELPKPFYWWKKEKRTSKWVSVKERKAPFGKRVLVQYTSGNVDEAAYFCGFLLEELYGPVLYWMPLPEPYKEATA